MLEYRSSSPRPASTSMGRAAASASNREKGATASRSSAGVRALVEQLEKHRRRSKSRSSRPGSFPSHPGARNSARRLRQRATRASMPANSAAAGSPRAPHHLVPFARAGSTLPRSPRNACSAQRPRGDSTSAPDASWLDERQCESVRLVLREAGAGHRAGEGRYRPKAIPTKTPWRSWPSWRPWPVSGDLYCPSPRSPGNATAPEPRWMMRRRTALLDLSQRRARRRRSARSACARVRTAACRREHFIGTARA